MQRHRAITSTGAVVDDPSVAQLADLVAEVDRSGRHGFLFLERRGPAAGDNYVQARRDAVGWVLELRDGGPSHHVEALVSDTAVVYASVVSWLFRTRGWQALSWERVGRRIASPGLAAAM